MKKTVLGIQGNFVEASGITNETSASLVIDGQLKSCIAEERISRIKLDGQFPHKAIAEVLKLEGILAEDVDIVAVPFSHPKKGNYKYFRAALKVFFDTGVFLGKTMRKFLWFSFYNSVKGPKQHYFELGGKKFALDYCDHHTAHAASAYYPSPFDSALIITLDGGGDGLDGSAFFGEKSKMTKLFEVHHFQSPGTMYSAVTLDLGFKRHRHEGKITGLAAYGKPDLKAMGLNDLVVYNKKKHRFVSKKVAAHHRDLSKKSTYFHPLLEKYGREDLAAVAQILLEREVLEFVKDAVEVAKKKGFNPKNVCLAGGCFANVKLNQGIRELDFCENVFVYPAMGDDGLSGGAALYSYYKHNPDAEKSAAEISEIYKGGEFTDNEIELALNEAKLPFTRYDNVELEIAKLLADSKVVGRFNGKMEYGPRALGNRSILASPFDPTINDWLNKRLNRTEFMPFAPSINVDHAKEYFLKYEESDIAADFMTITYEVNPDFAKKIPAVVHIDNTARPQVVRSSTNPSYYKIIDEFNHLTGVPVVLNTSFNIHEQPIVYTPQDAIAGYLEGKLDVLAMGSYIVNEGKN